MCMSGGQQSRRRGGGLAALPVLEALKVVVDVGLLTLVHRRHFTPLLTVTSGIHKGLWSDAEFDDFENAVTEGDESLLKVTGGR